MDYKEHTDKIIARHGELPPRDHELVKYAFGAMGYQTYACCNEIGEKLLSDEEYNDQLYACRDYESAAAEEGWQSIDDWDTDALLEQYGITGLAELLREVYEVSSDGCLPEPADDPYALGEITREQIDQAVQLIEDNYTYFKFGEYRSRRTDATAPTIDVDDSDDWEDLCNEKDIEVDIPEIFQWFAVSDDYAHYLKECGAVVLDYDGIEVWGRQTCGQAIYLDSISHEVMLHSPFCRWIPSQKMLPEAWRWNRQGNVTFAPRGLGPFGMEVQFKTPSDYQELLASISAFEKETGKTVAIYEYNPYYPDRAPTHALLGHRD